MRKHASYAVVMVIVVLLAGCGGSSDDAPVDTSVNVAADPFLGTWISEPLMDGYRELNTLNSDGTFVADYFIEREGALHWSAFTLRATYVIEGQSLTVTQANGTVETFTYVLEGDVATATAASGQQRRYTKYNGQPPLAPGSEIHKGSDGMN